jgi:hypothetical protein
MSEEKTDEQVQFEEFEIKMDELNKGLLEAYAAGFAKAAETFEGPDLDPSGLMDNTKIQEQHYHYWDGRTKPLEYWLRDEFGLNQSTADVSKSNNE